MVLNMTKTCKDCGKPKSLSEFWKHKSTKDRLSTYCKDCHGKRNAKWIVDHKEHHLKLQKDWYLKNRECHLNNTKNWSAQNLSKKASYRRSRRAKELNAPGSCTQEQLKARMAYFGNKCIYCGGPFEEVDHLIPISRGGSNWPSNLAPSCTKCNREKWTKTYKEFKECL